MCISDTCRVLLPHGCIYTFRCSPSIQQMACQAACHRRGILTFMTVWQKSATTKRRWLHIISHAFGRPNTERGGEGCSADAVAKA